jgi:hypothetical protein
MAWTRSGRRRCDVHRGDHSIPQRVDVMDYLIDEDIARCKVVNDLVDLDVDATVGEFRDTARLHVRVDRLPLVSPIRPDGIVALDPSIATHVGPVNVGRHVDE